MFLNDYLNASDLLGDRRHPVDKVDKMHMNYPHSVMIGKLARNYLTKYRLLV